MSNATLAVLPVPLHSEVGVSANNDTPPKTVNRENGTPKDELFTHTTTVLGDMSVTKLSVAPHLNNTDLKTPTESVKEPVWEKVISRTETAEEGPSLEDADRKQSYDVPEVNILRSKSKANRLKKDAQIAVSKFKVQESQLRDSPALMPKASRKGNGSDSERAPKSVSNSISRLARRTSWVIGSRSPSPSNGRAPVASVTSDNGRSPLENTVSNSSKAQDAQEKGESVNHRGSVLQKKGTSGIKKPRRPLSALLAKTASFGSDGPPEVPSLPRSFSSDRLPSLNNHQSLLQPSPLGSRSMSQDRTVKREAEIPRKRDELSSQFRVLDAEYQKFASKPGTIKAAVVRSALIPFLRTYHDHLSNKALRAEDLDRRVNILNKWWTGLLEMLNGRSGQSVSGNDRPVILEAAASIMVRNEWRLTMSEIPARTNKSRPFQRSESGASIQSTESDFLAESVLHNVRNIFVQNLLSQMAFVVGRISLFNVSASVVAFCGKATAYAFIFCPSVANILIRLWSVPVENIRRVLAENEIGRYGNMEETADHVAGAFPVHLRPLSFRSLPPLMRMLRNKAQLPLSSAYIPWNGPWVSRWSGKEYDLFFVFVKHYHILISELLPEGVTKRERMCAPGYVLVQAQMLTVMDATIHRSNTNSTMAPSEGPSPITFDDVLGADASATPLPFPGTNSTRIMSENRLIMLLREFLAESSNVNGTTRKAFAESYIDLLNSVARRVSLFDHGACFTLCDFFEEAMSILIRYHNDTLDPISFLDWPFWLKVFQQMMESNNSMTEVRLYSFIFSVWGWITKNEEKKKDVCLTWLLREDYFQSQFNNWCPMVRAYYMRLLCWRIARFDGDGSELDTLIFRTLAKCLQTTWRHFLYLQEIAEIGGTTPPSTVACNPAPGRRLLIVRSDSGPSLNGVFTSFDDIVEPSSAAPPSTYERYTSLDSLKIIPSSDPRHASLSSTSGKKRWSLLRNIIPFSNPPAESTKFKSNQACETTTTDVDGQSVIERHSAVRVSAETPPADSQTPPHIPQASRYTQHSFKFSLEWYDRTAHPMRDRKLLPPRLPLPAQIHLQTNHLELQNQAACKPQGLEVASSKYSGRALAEWTVLLIECQNFYERRKFEGVPGIKRMEVPTLGVESFRKPIG